MFFRASLRAFVENSGKRQNQIAGDLEIAASALNSYLGGERVPSLAQMEEIAEKIGKNLLDMLNEGKAILAGEVPPLVPAAAVNHLPESLPGSDLASIKALLSTLTINSDHEDIKDILKTIATATLGQIEATKRADMDIINAIKQNKIEEYERALDHLRQDLAEKDRLIANMESDQHRLKTRVEVKMDNVFTLVGGNSDDNAGCGGEKVA